jgi:hypothetical protein
MITLKYNKKKIILYLIFSFSVLSFFTILFLNADELALRKPSSSLKYRYVGLLFYNNENLIKFISIIISFTFIYLTISLSKMLFKKNLIFKKENGILYQNNKLIIETSKIKSLNLKKVNINHFIIFNLNEQFELLDSEKSILRKIKNKLLNFGKNKTISMNIDCIKNNPRDTLAIIKKLVDQ